MRFSLTTLLLAAFWIAALMLVWVRREPWTLTIAQKRNDHQESSLWASDRIRFVRVRNGALTINEGSFPNGDTRFELWRTDLPQEFPRTPELPIILTEPFVHEPVPAFLNDDAIVFFPSFGAHEYQYRRRFPEWWWGHFYRPEVWLALALTSVLFWRGARAWRTKAAL